MTKFLYQLFTSAFQAGMHLGALFSPKIKKGVEGRKNLLEKIESDLPAMISDRPLAWFHAASLGEFEQGRPVMEAFRRAYPDHFILLTFFSPSGYEIRKNYDGADYICYLPMDTADNARKFIRILKPRIVFFIKYEFWFNYLSELKKCGAGIVSFSAIFRPKQIFFQPYGNFYRKLLTYFDHILVQNQESLDLLIKSGISTGSLAGDTRFDRVQSIAEKTQDLPLVCAFLNGSPCLIAGSVWEADTQVLIPAMNEFRLPLQIIIAPHEIKTEEIESWRKKLSGSSVLYSELSEIPAGKSFDYLFIDNIGMLSSLYRYGNVAYIGGAFGSGLHNILEAATFGLPVLFGNKSFGRFQEAKDLVQEGGAIPVANSGEIVQILSNWCSNEKRRLAAGTINKNYVTAKTGATTVVMDKIKSMLNT